VTGPRIRVAHDHRREEGPLPDLPELSAVRLRRRGPGRRSALGHPGGRLQSLVLAIVGRRSRALCGSRGAPAAAFAFELARRGGSSAHRAGAPATGQRFRRPEAAARRALARLCRLHGCNNRQPRIPVSCSSARPGVFAAQACVCRFATTRPQMGWWCGGGASGRPQSVPLARRPAPGIAARCARAARRLRDSQFPPWSTRPGFHASSAP
jgi:hypothetical protein